MSVRAARLAYRLLIAAALAVDATIHLQLAGEYDYAAPAGIGEGNLFRIESALALAAAVAILLLDRWLAFAFAALVLGSALAAVLVYRYIDVPAFGPIPAMYEPVWFSKKVAATLAEAVGLGLAGAGLLLRPTRGRRSHGFVGTEWNQPVRMGRITNRHRFSSGRPGPTETGKGRV